MGFRQATEADLDRLIGMQADYYREDGYAHRPDEARRAWEGLLADASLGKVWVVEAASGLVGYVVVTFGYSLEYLGRDAFVDELYLVEAVRGQGLGRQALQVAEAACCEAGVRALHLEVEHRKDTAAELYRRSGFADHQRVLMTKLLTSGRGEP